ncbi:AMP-binding protein [Ramlibacter sp.]|uniref:AMP-binding protein n=1 Tax=Ramlibacter sp. TaxID=1917967 RepID=UPI002FC63DAD
MNNLAYLLSRAGALHGNRPATFHGDSVRDYRWLDDQVGRLASALLALGLAAGDRVGLLLDNEPRGLVGLFGPLRAGMAIVPMNPKLHSSEHAYMLEDCGARVVVASKRFVEPLMSANGLPAGLLVLGIDCDEGCFPNVRSFDSLLAGSQPDVHDANVSPDALAWIFYTSGTTGRPKGAMLTHRNLMTMVSTQLIECNPVKPDDRLAYMAPLSHSNGLMAFQHVARAAGHVFPTFQGFRTGEFYELVERHRVTTAFMVPTMIQMMLDDPSHRQHDISSLHTIIYGGAPMYVERLKEAIETFGRIFVQGYAQGEAPMGCTYLPKDEHHTASPEAERRLASAGRECIHVEVRIFDDDDRPLPANTPGEVVVRGDLVMHGYWQNPKANQDTLRNGWLHTGDIGYLDGDGYLFITDRKKDMIISGGSNVYPREIEEVLYQHPAVHEATVFGIPDRKWGERIVAAIVRKEGERLEEAEVVAWCLQHLASFKKPSEVRFVDTLPKSGYGKILKRDVRRALFPSL